MGDVNVKTSPRVSSAGASLRDIVKRREVRRIVYFHCDHFEPWRQSPGCRTIAENAVEVLRFAECSAANQFSRRLTLFYKCHQSVTRNLSGRGVVSLDPDDIFGFTPRTSEQEAVFAGAMRGLLERVRHEIQVHIHHEHHTYNSSHKNPEIIELFQRPDVRARDSARFELGLTLSLDAIRRETGLALERWFFVHGVWALNASDPTVCHITDEIEILMKNGCLGDFTFPAGRPAVDPIQEQPYFVRPFNAPRAYILPESEPELAYGNAGAAASKFFLWASNIRHMGSSLDYFAPHVLQKLLEPNPFAEEILQRSYVAGGTLYFKTHSHSMHSGYYSEDAKAIFPHQHPAVRKLMGTVFDAAEAAGASVEFLTASEVYDEFRKPRPAPPGGFALSLMRHLEDVDAAAIAVLSEAMRGEGQAAVGVGTYYERRVEQGSVLAPYELRVARALLREGPFDTIYEVGSGVSALPFFLALNGARSVGIERDSGRASLSRAILERLSLAHPHLTERCEIIRGSAPEALREVDGANCAAVFTNVTGSMAETAVEEIIRQMARFSMVVVDLSRFFEIRDATAQIKLRDRFLAAGWGDGAALESGDTYWMFRRPPELDPDTD